MAAPPAVQMAPGIPERVTAYRAGGAAVWVELAGLETWEHVRDKLAAMKDDDGNAIIDMENKVIVDENDSFIDLSSPLENNVPAFGVAVKTYANILVEHSGLQYECPILFDRTDKSLSTVGYVKQICEQSREHGDSFLTVNLTWKGQIVSDATLVDKLEDAQQSAARGLMLTGHKSVIVMDLDLGETHQAELPRVQDYQTIAEVMKEYQTQQRRLYLHEPLIAVWVEGETTAESIGDLPESKLLRQSQSVWDAEVAHNMVIALKTKMFEVVIKEQSDIDRAAQQLKGIGGAAGVAAQAAQASGANVGGIRVHAFDWHTVRTLKDNYSLAVTESLSSSDQLVLEGRDAVELDEGDMLMKYAVQDQSVLIVKREDFTQPTCLYTCADCGSDVRLKQRDAVRCRECGHRIVFKKRIQKPCQYLCR